MRLKRKADRSDDYTSPQGAFEDAVPVPERAVFSVQDERVEGLCAEHLDASDRILGFATVGSDVLDGCGPDFAGDEREILQSPQFVLHGPFDQVVPLDARVGFDRSRSPAVRPRCGYLVPQGSAVCRDSPA